MKRQPESWCEPLDVHGLRYNVRRWGNPDAPLVFFLHGWMDASPTFQFVVEALQHEWHVVAPDWRGFGATEWLGKPYWFPDYYSDLDVLLAHYSPDRPARLVGHSMGANIASNYAALRPDRVAQIAMLDFLGLPSTKPEDAAPRLRVWLDGFRRDPRMRVHDDHDAFARRLVEANPKLSAGQAEFLSHHLGRIRDDGRVEMAADAWHKMRSPTLYRIEEAMAFWRAIEAPVLMLIADLGYVHDRLDDDECRRRLACFRNASVVTIRDARHNVQHDQPEQVAVALEKFLSRD